MNSMILNILTSVITVLTSVITVLIYYKIKDIRTKSYLKKYK